MTDYFKLPSFPSFGVGFEDTFKRLSDMATAQVKSAGYPPYNIRKDGENKYVIEFAVAGFGESDLSIELDKGVLRVRGTVTRVEGDEDNLLYKGIADRPFDRQFALEDTVEVKNADLLNGMLRIGLEKMVELSPVKTIPINKEVKQASTKTVN